jgi:hypothetical protein
MIYPRLVYRNGGKYQRPGGTFDYIAVADETEHKAAIAGGWFDSLEDAVFGVKEAKPVETDTAPPTREEIRTKAKELGIKFGPNTSDEKLLQMIDAALAERAA